MLVGTGAQELAWVQCGVIDQQLPLAVEVTVARLDAQTLLVQSRQPLVVYASQLGLSDGVEALREVAGLPSISPAVPVSFNLTFREDG